MIESENQECDVGKKFYEVSLEGLSTCSSVNLTFMTVIVARCYNASRVLLGCLSPQTIRRQVILEMKWLITS